MNKILKLEEIGLFVLGIYLFSLFSFHWWWFLILFLIPDLGFLGYIISNKVGAIAYNFLHHRFLAITLFLLGMLFSLSWVGVLGAIFLSHISFDRVLGYGLKYFSGFKDTHLGEIGFNKNKRSD